MIRDVKDEWLYLEILLCKGQCMIVLLKSTNHANVAAWPMAALDNI